MLTIASRNTLTRNTVYGVLSDRMDATVKVYWIFTLVLINALTPCCCLSFNNEPIQQGFEDGYKLLDVGSHICGYCLCDYTLRVRSCANLGLKMFHTDKTHDWSWVETLDLSRNNLSEAPDLRLYENLRYLNLSFNADLEVLGEKSFDGLEKLEGLDLSNMGLTFESETIHSQVFESLRNLTILRMKQQTVKLSDKAVYSFLLGAKNSLQELSIIGHPNLVPVFEERFPCLRNLSLGGNNCNLTGLFNEDVSINLRDLSLVKLSLRNCRITSISAEYFKPLAKSLKKLDISCNPVHEALLNLTHGLQGGTLETLIADYINQKSGPKCDWNITGEMFISTLRMVSLQGNTIAHLVQGNSTNYMKHLQYLDVGYNTLGGSAFNILRRQCNDDLFWCNLAVSHQFKYIGVSGITRNNWSCRKPDRLECSADSELYSHDNFEWEKVSNPYYLDVFIILHFFAKANSTFANDINVYINNDFNVSTLPTDSIVRIFSESVERHPETGITFDDVVKSVLRNITSDHDFKIETLRILAKYICEDKHVIIMKETLTFWVNLVESGSATWSNESISRTVEGVCKHDDWNYGVDFMTNEKYRWFFTNWTTLVGHDNDITVIASPGDFCNDITFFFNNMRSGDMSYSQVPYISCANFRGGKYVERLVCKCCSNTKGWNMTAEDVPNLRHFDFSENFLGHFLREKVVLRGHRYLEVIRFDKQLTPVKYFQHRDMFSDQRKLLELHLPECGIEIWNISLSNNTVLKILNLRGNIIQYIEKPFQDDLMMVHNRSGLEVDLSENPTGCKCNHRTLEYINWILKSGVVVKRNELKCPDNTLLVNFVKGCSSNQQDRWASWKIFAIAIIGFVGLAILFAFGVVLRKVVVTRHRREYEPLPNDSLPTAFISYPPRMMDDVNALKDMIRDRFHLLAPGSESLFGDLISSGLSQAIFHSTKIILVVSDEYFEEDTTTWKEYRLMDSAGLIQRDKTILILTSPNLKSIQLPPVLKQLYKAGEFLIWPSGMCADQEFRKMVEKIVQKVGC